MPYCAKTGSTPFAAEGRPPASQWRIAIRLLCCRFSRCNSSAREISYAESNEITRARASSGMTAAALAKRPSLAPTATGVLEMHRGDGTLLDADAVGSEAL